MHCKLTPYKQLNKSIVCYLRLRVPVAVFFFFFPVRWPACGQCSLVTENILLFFLERICMKNLLFFLFFFLQIYNSSWRTLIGKNWVPYRNQIWNLWNFETPASFAFLELIFKKAPIILFQKSAHLKMDITGQNSISKTEQHHNKFLTPL